MHRGKLPREKGDLMALSSDHTKGNILKESEMAAGKLEYRITLASVLAN